ncbi:DUF2855 family protein [Pyruvatibacter sp.]|uniref:DUF2855 family protein n=1 Tax=Pyruvatibacter sp. TaxID=1981328 RepID=UPI0032EFF630
MVDQAVDFEVLKSALETSRANSHDLPQIGAGEVLMKVERFSLTANNITYAVFGDAMRYWDFFSDRGDGVEFGRIPVWGFGEVIASNADGVTVGTRVYGYFPMSTHRVAKAARISEHGFMDASGVRGELAPVYSQFMATTSDPLYAKQDEDQIMLFRPLFTTSFILDDWLAENGFFGAKTIILSSASSKTSLGLAYLLKNNRGSSVRVVGLTSGANKAFVEGTGCYDDVVVYDDISKMDASVAAGFVDMAGNSAVRAAIHRHFKDNLKVSSAVGGTHWDSVGGGQDDLPGPSVELFFAPTHIERRMKEWGGPGFQERVAKAWAGFIPETKKWIEVVHSSGADKVKDVYLEVLGGKTPPNKAHILSLWN